MSTNVICQSEMSVSEQLRFMGASLQDEVVGPGLVVVEEEVLHCGGAIAEAEHEVGVPEMGVVPHDVPDQRPFTDESHGLGTGCDAIAHPHPESAAEEDYFHFVTSDNLEFGNGKDQTRPP